jgi:hypothetical protein
MEAVNMYGCFPLLGSELQLIGHVDPFDNEDASLQLDLAPGFGLETSLCRRNPARFQRAPEGPGESAGGSGDDIVERCCMGFDRGVNLIVFRYFGMHPENNGLRFRREPGTPQGPPVPFYTDL